MRGTIIETKKEHGFYISHIYLGTTINRRSRFLNVYTAKLHDSFIQKEEHWTQEIAFPTALLTVQIRFPEARPPSRVKFFLVEGTTDKEIATTASITELFGQTAIVWQLENPRLKDKHPSRYGRLGRIGRAPFELAVVIIDLPEQRDAVDLECAESPRGGQAKAGKRRGSYGYRRPQSVQPNDFGDRRRARAPRTPEPQHEASDRRHGMPVDGADIERADRLAAWAVYLKPRRARHEGSADRRRPPHVAAGRERSIPPFDHPRRVVPRGLIGGVVLQISC
jgi:hypothetical protein